MSKKTTIKLFDSYTHPESEENPVRKEKHIHVYTEDTLKLDSQPPRVFVEIHNVDLEGLTSNRGASVDITLGLSQAAADFLGLTEPASDSIPDSHLVYRAFRESVEKRRSFLLMEERSGNVVTYKLDNNRQFEVTEESDSRFSIIDLNNPHGRVVGVANSWIEVGDFLYAAGTLPTL